MLAVFFGFLHLFRRLLDVDLGAQTTTRSGSLAVQLFKGLQVLVSEGV